MMRESSKIESSNMTIFIVFVLHILFSYEHLLGCMFVFSVVFYFKNSQLWLLTFFQSSVFFPNQQSMCVCVRRTIVHPELNCMTRGFIESFMMHTAQLFFIWSLCGGMVAQHVLTWFLLWSGICTFAIWCSFFSSSLLHLQ